MKLFPIPKLLLVLFLAPCACLNSDVESVAPQPTDDNTFVVTDVYGRRYPSLDPSVIYCGPGWGAKMCHFLYKHDGTTWADPEHAYSEFPDVRFSNFWDPFFISFLQVDSTASYCEGWQLGETIYNGARWDIVIKVDQEDTFWFDYHDYGTGEQIERTVTHKYEVIDGLLHYSSTDGRAFVYHPSAREYAEDSLNTEALVEREGCLFY